MKWLGVLIDSILMRLFMPGEKVVKLEEKIKEFVETGSMTAFRELAEIAGTLLSMGVAIYHPSEDDTPGAVQAHQAFRVGGWLGGNDAKDGRNDQLHEVLDQGRRWRGRKAPKVERSWLRLQSCLTSAWVEHLELVADAGGGVGYRLGQAEHTLGAHKEVSIPHEQECDAHVHKEVAALVSVVEKEGPQHITANSHGGVWCT